MKWILLILGVIAISIGLGTGEPLVMVNGTMCAAMGALGLMERQT